MSPPTVRILLFTDPSGRNSVSSRGNARQRRLVFDSESVRRDEGIVTEGKEKYDEVVGGVGYKVSESSRHLGYRNRFKFTAISPRVFEVQVHCMGVVSCLVASRGI